MASLSVSRGASRGRSRSTVRSKLIEVTEAVGNTLSHKDYALGIGLLLIVVTLWTTSNFVTQDLYEEGYEKPFFVTYLNTSAFTLYLIPVGIRALRRSRSKLPVEHYEPLSSSQELDPELEHTNLAPLTTRETARLSGAFCVLWFLANWTVNAALDYTSVASSTILSATSGFFTMGIGAIFRVEHFTLLKICAVMTSFTGVLLVSLSDSRPGSQTPGDANATASPQIAGHPEQPVLGDALALISALFYALYVILLKVRIKYESRIDMQLFFGFVGLFNLIGGLPVAGLLHLLEFEKLGLPSSPKMYIALAVNMAITWSSDYLYVLAMLKTTPLVVTVGLSLTIPFAVIGDFILNKPVKLQVVGGALIVLTSFVVLGLDKTNTEEPTPLEAVQLEEEEPLSPIHEAEERQELALERGRPGR